MTTSQPSNTPSPSEEHTKPATIMVGYDPPPQGGGTTSVSSNSSDTSRPLFARISYMVYAGMGAVIATVLVIGFLWMCGQSDQSNPPPNTPYPQPVQPIGVENAWRVVQLTRWGGSIPYGIAFSLDGRLLAVASGTGIFLYDAADLSEVRFIATDAAIFGVAFAPDGRLLASGSNDNTVRLWDVQTGALLHTLEGHTAVVIGVAFAPDGRLLASSAWDDTVRLWEVATGQPVRRTQGNTSEVLSVTFAPDGRLLASSSPDGAIRLWDAPTGALLRTLEGHTDWVWSVAFAPDERLLASGSRDGTIRLWGVP